MLKHLESSYLVLVASLLIALGGWGTSLQNWTQVLDVGNVFALLGIIGGVLLAWLGKSPIPKEEEDVRSAAGSGGVVHTDGASRGN